MGHSQFNFKSSGIKTTSRVFKPKSEIKRSVGIKTPLSEGDDIFEMHNDPVKQLADNFRNLIMTNHGERLGMHDFGANLNGLVFEFSNAPNFESILSEAITEVTSRYIPAIAINSITTVSIDETEKNNLNLLGLTKTTVRIEYTIPKLNSPLLGIEVDVIVGG